MKKKKKLLRLWYCWTIYGSGLKLTWCPQVVNTIRVANSGLEMPGDLGVDAEGGRIWGAEGEHSRYDLFKTAFSLGEICCNSGRSPATAWRLAALTVLNHVMPLYSSGEAGKAYSHGIHVGNDQASVPDLPSLTCVSVPLTCALFHIDINVTQSFI